MEGKKPLIIIDIKHAAVKLTYKNTKDFLRKAIKESWINTFKTSIDETKQRGLNHVINELTETIKIDQVKDLNIDDIITETKPRVVSFFYELPSTNSVVHNSKNDSQFTVPPTLKTFWSELTASSFEVKLIHVESAFKFKEEIWKKIVSKLEQDLNTTAQIFRTPEDVLSLVEGRESGYLLTARPKFFSGVWNKREAIKLIYLNGNLKMAYKYKHEEFVTSKVPPVGEISCLSQLIGLMEFQKVQKEKGSDQKIIRVGYDLTAKRFGVLQDGNRALTPSYPVLYTPVDLRFGLNRKIDILFHRYTDFEKDVHDYECQLKVANFKDIYHNPKAGEKVKVVDPPDCLEIINNRMTFQDTFVSLLNSKEFEHALDEYFATTKNKKVAIKIPLAKKVIPTAVTDIKEMITTLGLKYPLIVKTLASSVTANSHKMAVALTEEGLQEIENHKIYKVEDHLLQELINHDGRIYKVYVIGSEILVQQKQSIPNITQESLGLDHFYFDSQKSFHEVEFFKNKISFEKGEIDVGAMKILCQFISKRLNLSMFGVDIVEETGTGTYYLVDINYFPGYTGCKNLDVLLKKNILQQAQEK